MNILNLAEILKQVSGGNTQENTDVKIDKIKNKAEDMQERVDNAYDDLNMPNNQTVRVVEKRDY